jgi:hypothetical protein
VNARKRARRRAERERPTVIMQEEYRPHYTDPAVYFIPALDGNGRAVVVAITRAQARKLGFSEGLIQREIAEAWKRIACARRKVAGAAGESNPEPDSGAMHRDTAVPAAPLVTSRPDASQALALTASAETSLPWDADPDVRVELYLDGPRGMARPRPVDWEQWSEAQRTDFIDAIKRELLGNTVAFSLKGIRDWDYTGPSELPDRW